LSLKAEVLGFQGAGCGVWFRIQGSGLRVQGQGLEFMFFSVRVEVSWCRSLCVDPFSDVIEEAKSAYTLGQNPSEGGSVQKKIEALRSAPVSTTWIAEDRLGQTEKAAGGPDIIRPFRRISSGVRVCWELEEPKGRNVPDTGPPALLSDPDHLPREYQQRVRSSWWSTGSQPISACVHRGVHCE
jgi:hypothetical protein